MMSPITKEFGTCLISCDSSAQSMESNLEIRASWIDENFQGLFVTKTISMGQTLCIYRGLQLNTVEALRTTDKSYLMRIGVQNYVDVKDYPDCLAR